MLLLETVEHQDIPEGLANARTALLKALDLGSLWKACCDFVTRILPCHSCSLMFDIDGYEPRQGKHHLIDRQHDAGPPVTSLDIAAPYLDANPQIRWYTFSQIASQDAAAFARLRAQNPAPGWREFIHLAFWNASRLDAVISIRLREDWSGPTNRELSLLSEFHALFDACLQRVIALEGEREKHRVLDSLMRRQRTATLVLDEKLAPVYMSAGAEQLLERIGNERRHQPRLPASVERALRHWMRERPDHDHPSRDSDGDRGDMLTIEDPATRMTLKFEVDRLQAEGSWRRYFVLTCMAGDSGSAGIPADPDTTSARLDVLSPGERRVAVLVAKGMRNNEIAETLFRSRKTIESQISAIYRKLDVNNRVQLARLLA